MKKIRVWVSRDEDFANYVDLWDKQPKHDSDGRFDCDMHYLGELSLAKEIGIGPRECREFYLVPVKKP